jgi:hypothetical protein
MRPARNVPRRRVYAAWASGPLAVLLGAGAHVLGGEDLPGPWVLLALSALLSMAASMLARFKLPMWALLLASGVIQQVLHLLFSWLSANVGSASTGHAHGVLPWLPPQQPADAGGHHAMELMLDAHVAAALLTVMVITQSVAMAKRAGGRRGIAGRR